IRFPKGAAGDSEAQPARTIPVGEWEVLRQGSAALLLATGKLVPVAMEAAIMLDNEGLPLTVVNSRFIKPLDPRLESWARRNPAVRLREMATSRDALAAGRAYQQQLLALLGTDDPAQVMELTEPLLRTVLTDAASDLRQRPAPAEWSVLELLGHLVDAEMVMSARFRWT